MHLICFSVHDAKAEAFLPPFFASTLGVGKRMFEQAANDPESNFGRFSDDYTLYELGKFNCQTGMTTFLSTPKSLGLAAIFKSPELGPDTTGPISLIQGGE